MNALSGFFTPAIGFLLTLSFGLWLSRVGRPYNGILFNIHKLIALGTVVLATIRVYEALKAREIQTLIILSIVGVAIGVVASFATGAFMSIGKLNYRAMKTIHTIAPIVVVIALALMISLFAENPL